ncbi:MAG: ABC transporter permease [Bacteroidales bacterium]
MLLKSIIAFFKEKIILLSMLSLLLGITSFIIIFSYISFELSFDNFHNKKDRIFKVCVQMYKEGTMINNWATSPCPFGPTMKSELSEVVQYCRLSNDQFNTAILLDNEYFTDEHILYADTNFFSFFDFKIIKGTANSLQDVNAVILTEKAALKYFGTVDVIGKHLLFSNSKRKYPCKVSAVIENMPKNSTIQADIFKPFYQFFINKGADIEGNWMNHPIYTYLLLADNVSPERVVSKFSQVLKGTPQNDIAKEINRIYDYDLMPLSDIHLKSDKLWEIDRNRNDITTVRILMVVGFIILLISYINYLNLSVIGWLKKTKDVIIKKVIGLSFPDLLKYVFSISFLGNLVPILLSVLLLLTFINKLAIFSDDTISVYLSNLDFWLFLSIVFVVAVVFFTVFFIQVISNFKVTSVIAGNTKSYNLRKGKIFKKSLIVFQIGASLALFIAIFIVSKQVEFMKNKDLGFKMEDRFVIHLKNINTDSSSVNKMESFKQELINFSAIDKVAYSGDIMGYECSKTIFKLQGQDMKEATSYPYIIVDKDFLSMYSFSIIAGRDFSENQTNDESSIIITRNAATCFGFVTMDEAIGNEIYERGRLFKIIGVVEDFNMLTPKLACEPILILPSGFRKERAYTYCSVGITNKNSFKATLSTVEDQWAKFFPGIPLSYFVLKDEYITQYKSEFQLLKLFKFFSFVAILISVLGLISLSYNDFSLRKKEIGIRKLLGSSLKDLIKELSMNYIVLTIIAATISIPVVFLFFSGWLENFSYRISMPYMVFIYSFLAIFTMVNMVLFYIIIVVSNKNPVDVIYEP